MDLTVLTKRRNEIALAVIVFAVVAGVGLYGYAQANVNSQEGSYETYANVTESGENISVGVETGEGLEFGKLVEDTNMTKTLELNTSNNTLALVEVSADGNISDFVEYEKTHLFRNGTGIEVMMVGEEAGYFDGEILLDIKTAANDWGEVWLKLLYLLP